MKLSVDIHLSKLNQNLNCWIKSKFRLLIFWKIVFSSPSRFIVIQDLHHRDEWVQIYTYLLHLLLQKSSFGDIVPLSGKSRNFRTGVRGPVAIEFLGFGDCFDAPSYIPYIFLQWDRVENMIHIINIACWLQLKKMHLKFTTTHPPHTQKIKQGGAGPSWIRLCLYTIDFVEIRYNYNLACEDVAFSALMVI